MACVYLRYRNCTVMSFFDDVQKKKKTAIKQESDSWLCNMIDTVILTTSPEMSTVILPPSHGKLEVVKHLYVFYKLYNTFNIN